MLRNLLTSSLVVAGVLVAPAFGEWEQEASPVQIGCITTANLDPNYPKGSICTLSASWVHTFCCSSGWGYALGGALPTTKMGTHHDEFQCLKQRPTVYERYESCDQPCPGASLYKNPYVDGMCGGGCDSCPLFPEYESECTSDASVACGSLWSVYDCAQTEPKVNYGLPGKSSAAESANSATATTGAAETATTGAAASATAVGLCSTALALMAVFVL